MALQKHADVTQFGELLLTLYRLSHDQPLDTFQDAALGLVRQVLPFDTCMWGTGMRQPNGVGIDIHTIHLHRLGPDMIAGYEEVKHQDFAAAAMSGQARATRGFNADALFTDGKGPDFRAYLSRFKLENCFLTTRTDEKTDFTQWISLFRAKAADHCTHEEAQFLHQLAPHVMQALALNRVVHLDRLVPGHAAPQRGAAISDLRGVVYHADPRFKELLAVEWTDWKGPALPKPLLAQLLSGHERFAGNTLVVNRRVEHRLLFLSARPRCPADNLTDRESAIAQLIAKGNTHKEIARLLDRSPATVRNHIQSIYAKLSVDNIAGLIEALRGLD
jgi:DNA-binding CsgD family transcriptional regulator